MSGDEQTRVLMEIRDILRQQAERTQAEAAANAEYRTWATKSHEASQSHIRELAERQKNAMRIYLFLILSIIIVGFFAISQELKSTIKESISPKIDPVENAIKNFRPQKTSP